MCRTWSITYLCNHTCPFRLSTCLGHHTLTPSSPTTSSPTISSIAPPQKPSCLSPTTLTLSSPQCCGPCSLDLATTELKEEWTHRRARLAVRAARRASVDQQARLAAGTTTYAAAGGPAVIARPAGVGVVGGVSTAGNAAEELRLAEEEFVNRLWRLEKVDFPNFTASMKRLRRVERMVRREGSLLRREVRREDVVEIVDVEGWADAVEEDGRRDSGIDVEEDKADAEIDEVEDTEDEGIDVGEDDDGERDYAPPKQAKSATTTLTIRPHSTNQETKPQKLKTSTLGAVLETCRLPTLVELTISS